MLFQRNAKQVQMLVSVSGLSCSLSWPIMYRHHPPVLYMCTHHSLVGHFTWQSSAQTPKLVVTCLVLSFQDHLSYHQLLTPSPVLTSLTATSTSSFQTPASNTAQDYLPSGSPLPVSCQKIKPLRMWNPVTSGDMFHFNQQWCRPTNPYHTPTAHAHCGHKIFSLPLWVWRSGEHLVIAHVG